MILTLMAQVPKITTDDIKMSEETGLPPVITSDKSGIVFGRPVEDIPLSQAVREKSKDELYESLNRPRTLEELRALDAPVEDMTGPFLNALLTIYGPGKFVKLGRAAMATKVGSKLIQPLSRVMSKLSGITKFFGSHPKTATAIKAAADTAGYYAVGSLDEPTGGVAPALYSAYLLGSGGGPGGYLTLSRGKGVKGALSNVGKLGARYEFSKPIGDLADNISGIPARLSDEADARYAKEDPEMFGRALVQMVINNKRIITDDDGSQHFIPSPEQERMMRRLKKTDPNTYRQVIKVYKPLITKADSSLGK